MYRQHWWRCSGPCKDRPPYYGYVKRAMNRAPSPHDTWWADHQRACGGRYVKVKEPDNYKMKGKGAPFNSIKGKGPQRSAGDGSLNHSKGQQEKGQSSKMVIINGIVQKASNVGQITKTDTESKFPGHGIQLGSCSTQGRRRPTQSNASSSTRGMDMFASGSTSMKAGRAAPPLPKDHKSPAKTTARPSVSPKAGTKRPPNYDIRDMFLWGGATEKKVKVSSGSDTGALAQQVTTAGSSPIKVGPGGPEHSCMSSSAVTHSGSPSVEQVAAGGAASGVNVYAETSANPLIDLTRSCEGVDEEVLCPVCAVPVPKGAINEHLDQCLQ